MATIAYVEMDQARDDVRKTYSAIADQMGGNVPAILRALAHNPQIFKAFISLNTASNVTQLAATLRDLAYLKVSQINGCHYCAFYHEMTGRQAGVTDAQIQAIADFEASPEFTDLEKNVLRYAEQVTRQLTPNPKLVAELTTQLSDRELMELTFTIALANFTNRFNLALGNELP